MANTLQKFQELPAYTTDRAAGGELPIWSGKAAVPAIGSDIQTRINGRSQI